MNSITIRLFFISSIFSIHLIPFAKFFYFETFPILLVCLCVVLFLIHFDSIVKDFDKNKLSFLLILTIVIIFLIHLSNENQNILDLFKFFVGPLTFFMYPILKKYINFKDLYIFGLLIIILYLIFKYQPPLIFDSTCQPISFFIARLDCANLENLNKPFLITPEPSYLSLMLGYFLIIFNFSKSKIKKKDILDLQKKIYFINFAILFIIFDTASRLGSLIIIGFLIYFFLENKKSFIYFIFLFFILLILFIIFNISLEVYSKKIANINILYSRFIFFDFYNNKNFYDFAILFSKEEPTGFIRFFHNYLAVYGFKQNLMGNGFGSYPYLWSDYVVQNNFINLLEVNEVMKLWMENLYEKKQYVQNYFFAALHDGGLFLAALLLFLFLKAITLINFTQKIKYFCLIYFIVSFFFQSPLTSPYPWLALGLIYDKDK